MCLCSKSDWPALKREQRTEMLVVPRHLEITVVTNLSLHCLKFLHCLVN